MKFRRNVQLYRGSLDATPLATLFFLLVMFMILGSRMYTPGVHIQLPPADGELPGTDRLTVKVAMDAGGNLYFQNQLIDKRQLKVRLTEAVKASPEPLVLEVFADKAVTQEHLDALRTLARQAGIRDISETRAPNNLGENPAAGKTGNP